ncbi:hypothetical protein F5D26_11875 [Burkholderia pseudomallei]|nr:hypothetical protein F5D26_11875 [Burkholderia pseudomallei]
MRNVHARGKRRGARAIRPIASMPAVPADSSARCAGGGSRCVVAAFAAARRAMRGTGRHGARAPARHARTTRAWAACACR